MIELWDHQNRLVSGIRSSWKSGNKRALACLPTGGGKTVVFSYIGSKSKSRVLILVDRSELLSQASKTLDQFGVDHGIITQKTKVYPDGHTIAMVETWIRRIKKHPELLDFGLFIIDEAHKGAFTKAIKAIPKDSYLIGFTATPKSTGKPHLKELYQDCIIGSDIPELLQLGKLCPAITYSAKIDRSDLVKQAGEYTDESQIKMFDKPKVYRGMIDKWREFASGRKTICFNVNVADSKETTRQWNAAGIPAMHLDGETPDDERERILMAFARGEFLILNNVGIVTTGFDEPSVSCIVIKRATTSMPLYLQMCLDTETEILTKDGWKRYDTLHNGDIVASYNMNNERIEYVECYDKVYRTIHDSEYMVSLSSPFIDFRVTNQHNLLSRNRSRYSVSKFELKTADDTMNIKYGFEMPISGHEDIQDNKELSDSDLRFLGWFLSDGTKSKATKQITISQSASQPGTHHNSIKECIESCGFKYGYTIARRTGELSKYSDVVQYTISYGNPRGIDKHLTGWSRIEKYVDKNISNDLLTISKRQLLILLSTLNMGDGSKLRNPDYTPKSMKITMGDNKIMGDRLQQLCVTRGIKCNMSVHYYNRKPIYMLQIKDKTYASIKGHNERNGTNIIVSPHIQGEKVWCVSNVNGTIITRRNGKVLIMGNCGRGGRIFPGKENFIIIDMAENYKFLGGTWDSVRDWGHIFSNPKKKGQGVAPVKRCPKCEAIIPASASMCQYCLHVFTKKENEQAIKDVEFEVVKPTKFIPVPLPKPSRDTWWSLSPLQVSEIVKSGTYKKGWAVNLMRERGLLQEYADIMGYHQGWVDRMEKFS